MRGGGEKKGEGGEEVCWSSLEDRQLLDSSNEDSVVNPGNVTSASGRWQSAQRVVVTGGTQGLQNTQTEPDNNVWK